jgi:hypothetical protein
MIAPMKSPLRCDSGPRVTPRRMSMVGWSMSVAGGVLMIWVSPLAGL